MFDKRVTIFVGHFGSGKTEIAINGALDLARSGASVTLVDLDVVKPYFRSRSARELLKERGIRLLAPGGDNIFADLPIVIPEIRSGLREGTSKLILDVGGDDTGARVLGSLSDVVPVEDTDVLLVLNFRRPFTKNVDEAVKMVREIEAVSKMSVTGLISNTHLMAETTEAIVVEGLDSARETSRRLEIPLAGVCAEDGSAEELKRADLPCEVFRLRRIVRPPFEKHPEQRTSGPLFVLN